MMSVRGTEIIGVVEVAVTIIIIIIIEPDRIPNITLDRCGNNRLSPLAAYLSLIVCPANLVGLGWGYERVTQRWLCPGRVAEECDCTLPRCLKGSHATSIRITRCVPCIRGCSSQTIRRINSLYVNSNHIAVAEALNTEVHCHRPGGAY